MRSCKRAGSSVSRPRLCAFVAEDLRLLSPKPEADAPDRSWAWLQSLLPTHHGVLLRAWRAPRSILRQEKRATVCCSCGASVLKEAVMVAARPSARAGVKHACQIAVEADMVQRSVGLSGVMLSCPTCRAAISAWLTASHPNSEVKQVRAGVVLRWGTTREGPVLLFSSFLFLFSVPLS